MQYLVDMHREPMEAPDFLDWHHASQEFSGLLEDWWWWSHEQKRPITHVIVEQNAAQRFLLQYDHVQRWRSERSVQIIPHSTNRNKSDADYGVQTIAPHYFFGRVRLPGSVADGSKKAMEPLMPRITDQFQAYLRELRLDDLKGSAGVLRLKEELLRRVNVAAAPYKVRDVLLKEMIVQ